MLFVLYDAKTCYCFDLLPELVVTNVNFFCYGRRPSQCTTGNCIGILTVQVGSWDGLGPRRRLFGTWLVRKLQNKAIAQKLQEELYPIAVLHLLKLLICSLEFHTVLKRPIVVGVVCCQHLLKTQQIQFPPSSSLWGDLEIPIRLLSFRRILRFSVLVLATVAPLQYRCQKPSFYPQTKGEQLLL